jgi:hypothetical protein
VELQSPASGGTIAQVRIPASVTSEEAAGGARLPARFAAGPGRIAAAHAGRLSGPRRPSARLGGAGPCGPGRFGAG